MKQTTKPVVKQEVKAIAKQTAKPNVGNSVPWLPSNYDKDGLGNRIAEEFMPGLTLIDLYLESYDEKPKSDVWDQAYGYMKSVFAKSPWQIIQGLDIFEWNPTLSEVDDNTIKAIIRFTYSDQHKYVMQRVTVMVRTEIPGDPQAYAEKFVLGLIGPRRLYINPAVYNLSSEDDIQKYFVNHISQSGIDVRAGLQIKSAIVYQKEYDSKLVQLIFAVASTGVELDPITFTLRADTPISQRRRLFRRRNHHHR